ncbi:hypothetical protein A0H81_13005 [Grifola frondosa]|uniref:Uncharacterized protein n=1 Tax=Grifola frondosa TaxID=5627 RepID=A0A1C7LSU4_GRIFR|nr:hypothetical protein A0H81_13005 [Grifola frondosa]
MSDHADDPSRTSFPLLVEGNYAEWAIQMEAELIRKKLWDVVVMEVDTPEGLSVSETADWWQKLLDKRAKSRMAEARAEMVRRVSGGQLVHLVSRDPAICWKTLAEVHRTHGFATRLALRRQFYRAMKGGGRRCRRGFLG